MAVGAHLHWKVSSRRRENGWQKQEEPCDDGGVICIISQQEKQPNVPLKSSSGDFLKLFPGGNSPVWRRRWVGRTNVLVIGCWLVITRNLAPLCSGSQSGSNQETGFVSC